MPKYELIIFDCDGTLVDTEYVHNKILSDVLASFGHPGYSPEFCMKHITGKSIVDILHFFRDELKVEQSFDMIKECIKRQTLESTLEVVATPNANKLLLQINQKKCVVSNGNRNRVLHCLEITNLIDFFSEKHIFTHELVQRPKPAPDLFLYASKIMNANPVKSIVIEDSPTGVRGAKSADMTVIGYIGASHQDDLTKSQLIQAGADFIINDLMEALNYVE